MNCKYRFRNRGLFTADRNLNGNTARFTRQNENGGRRGYECSEERDYYPYWTPTPWVDVAIYTNNASRCPYYRSESENIKGRWFCSLPDKWYHYMISKGGNGNEGFIPNTSELCLALNNPSSQMMAYLRQEAALDAADVKAVISSEYYACLSMASKGPLTNGTSLATLDAACPACPANWTTHPYTLCRVCIPETCAATLVAVNLSAYASNSGCPPGSSVDANNNPSFCISNACIGQSSTYEQLAAVDSCRATYISQHGYLVDSNGLCIERQAVSANCQSLDVTYANWTYSPPHNATLTFLDPDGPFCTNSPWSRPNHLGNGYGGFQNGYNWTIPPQYAEFCAFRIRYNISTADYAGLDPFDSGQVNSSLNRPNNDNAAKIPIDAYYGIPTSDSTMPWRNARGYLFQEKPNVQIFDYFSLRQYCATAQQVVPGDPTRCYTDTNVQNPNRATEPAMEGFCPPSYPYIYPAYGAQGTVACSNTGTSTGTNVPMSTTDDDFVLQLAINTNQFGRTFQDRTHRFAIRQRPPELAATCGNIYSLNVRGKRGNIVQVFPATEYDFTPNRLMIAEGECIHFQWTGSNTNPNNNDGEGELGTDRHNAVQQICIRGMGGLGVYGPGGYGADGTTWTTKDLKPGWQGWTQNRFPTMGDVQCPPANYPHHTEPHPYNWLKCVQPAPTCIFTPRPYTLTTAADGTQSRVYGTCPTGSQPDSQNPTACVTSSCTVVDRPPNPTQWISGLDPLDPSFPGYNATQIGTPNALKHGCWGMSFPEHLDNVTFLGFSRADLQHLAILDNMQLGGNLKQLDDAGTYYDLGVRTVGNVGTYYYMCTRNNNFSNRGQKGSIIVLSTPQNRGLVGATGGIVPLSTAQSYTPTPMTPTAIKTQNSYWLDVPANCLTASTHVGLSTQPAPSGLSTASDVLTVSPANLACIPQLNPSPLVISGSRRVDTISGSITANVQIINASAVAFTVTATNNGFKSFVQQWQSDVNAGLRTGPAYVTVKFWTKNGNVVSPTLTEYFTAQYTITDEWVNMAVTQMQAFETGLIWITLTADGVQYTGPTTLVPGTGQPITIRMPVSFVAAVFLCERNTTRSCPYIYIYRRERELQGGGGRNNLKTPFYLFSVSMMPWHRVLFTFRCIPLRLFLISPPLLVSASANRSL